MTDEPKVKNDEKMKNEDADKSTVRTFAEELSVAGSNLLQHVQDLVQKGNIRRLILKDQNGRILLEVPLTLGVVGGAGVVFFAPFLAAIGAIAALVSRIQVIVERYENPQDAEKEKGPTVVDVNPLSDETPKE